MSAALVLVVGPSGAGKDTLIAKARGALSGDRRFHFVRRLVTREAIVDLEDHDSIDRDAFREGEVRGDYGLSWEAHGLGYALPASIYGELAVGNVVIANVSRQVIADAMARFPGCRVVLVTADAAVRARRLASRGRESEPEIATRLRREVNALPADLSPIVIDNSGDLSEAVDVFVAALNAIASS